MARARIQGAGRIKATIGPASAAMTVVQLIVRVLLFELAHMSARSIEFWTAMLRPQSDVLVEESDHLADRVPG